MDIKTWFARAVAAGLLPEWENITTRFVNPTDEINRYIFVDNDDNGDYLSLDGKMVEFFSGIIQLRKDGKDLYELEWRKPTESDVGKTCWFLDGDATTSTLLTKVEKEIKFFYFYGKRTQGYRCLLADHPFQPTKQDFKRIYGDQ